MPRNGQGVYSLPPVYEAVTGETIEAQQHNVPLEDLAADANNARPVSTGGTGAQSVTQARENLDVYSKAESVQAAKDAIGSLAAKETPIDADSVVIVDSADGNKPKKTLWSKIKALVNTSSVGAAIAASTGKATPGDGDFFAGVEAGGSTMFKSTWANIKAALSTVFIKKAGDILTGSLGGIAATASEDWLASFWADSAGGAYANVPKRRVPFKAQTTTIGNTYAPVLNATYNTSAWGGVWTQGVINLGTNAQATSYQLIHMHNDGQAQKTWTFDGKNGNFIADGVLFAAGAQFQTNGNIVGTVWQNWGAADAFTAISKRIEDRAWAIGNERANAWAVQEANGVRNEVWWRARDYMLGELVPVGCTALARYRGSNSVGTGDQVTGSLLDWSNAGNQPGGVINYGTWACLGYTLNSHSNRTTLWKRVA